jgi:hypothetical protein
MQAAWWQEREDEVMNGFLVEASKQRSSRNNVGAESLVAIGRGYNEFARFAVVHQKTTGFFG